MIQSIFSGGILRAIVLSLLLLALVIGLLGAAASVFGTPTMQRAVNVGLDKVAELCLNPTGCAPAPATPTPTSKP